MLAGWLSKCMHPEAGCDRSLDACPNMGIWHMAQGHTIPQEVHLKKVLTFSMDFLLVVCSDCSVAYQDTGRSNLSTLPPMQMAVYPVGGWDCLRCAAGVGYLDAWKQ